MDCIYPDWVEIADIALDLIRDDSAAGRVVVRWANESGSRVIS